MAKTFEEKLIELGFPDDDKIKDLAEFCRPSNSGIILFSFENTGDLETSCSHCTAIGTPQTFAEAIFGIATLAAEKIIQSGIDQNQLPPSAIDDDDMIHKYRLLYFASLVNDYFGDNNDMLDTLKGNEHSTLN